MQISFAVHKKLGKEASLMLSYFIYNSSNNPDFKGNINIVNRTREYIMKDLDLTRTEYNRGRDILTSNGLLTVIEHYNGNSNGFKLNVKNIHIFIGLVESNNGYSETNSGSPETNSGLVESNNGSQEVTTYNQESIINNLYPLTVNIPSQQQAVSLQEQALSGKVDIDYANDSFEEITRKLEKQESKPMDIHPLMEVGWLDTPSSIKAKAKKTRKEIKDIDSRIDAKWIPFQEYLEQFGILYPCHRDITKTRKAGLELIKKHQEWTPEDIASIISKIEKHYPVYCSKNGEFSKGPYNYLINELWTIDTTIKKYDPSASKLANGESKFGKGWD